MMKKLTKILLAAVLCIAGHGVAKAEIITDPSQLSNTKVYTINTARGYLNLNVDQTFLVGSMVRDEDSESETYNQYVYPNENAAEDDASRQFGILLIDGRYYIYSPKLKQFAFLHNQTLEFYSTAGTGLTFTTDGQEGAPLRLRIPVWGTSGVSTDRTYYVNNNGNIVLNTYTGVDPGNSLMIEEVEGATLDFEEAMEVFNTPSEWMDPHKVYNIACARTDNWTIATDGKSICGIVEAANGNPTSPEADQQWAFYRDGGKVYLYNVGMQMFVDKNGQLTTSKDEFANVDLIMNNNDNYPYTLFIVDNGKWFNGQSHGGMSVNVWKSNFDDGNRQTITEVPGQDAYDDMQAFFEIPSWNITYRLYFDGQEIATAVRNMTQGTEAALPSDMIYNSCEYEYDPAYVDDASDVRVDVTWMGPFEFSDSYENATWYNMLFDRENEGRTGRWYAYWEEGTEPYYPKLNADEATRAAAQCQWAFVGNPYQLQIYNKAAGPDVTLAFEAVNGANAAVLRPGEHFWAAMEYNPGPDVHVIDANEFSLAVWRDGTLYRMNQVGGAKAESYFGLWTGFDQGSGVSVEEVPEIDVTDVYYDIIYDGQVVATDKIIGQEIGVPIAEIPSSLQRDFVEFEYDDSQDVTPDLHVQVTATWVGPFELAKDYSSAHWYDMSVRGNWYVTSELTDDEGALKTVQANALGLGEDSYQWAFVGDPWNVKLYNKAKGSGVAYAWTVAENKHIPTFVDASTANVWTIRESTNSDPIYTDAFLITIPGLGWQVNQFGGAGGTLKIWNSTGTSDIGSLFAVFDVPDDYAEFVADDIAPIMEIESKWCNWTDEARAAIGYKPEYKESCTLDQYRSMRNAIEALKDDINNFQLPETGFYRFRNKYHQDYINMQTDLVNGSLEDTQASTVLKLTKVGDREYTIQAQEEYFQPLERSTTMVTDPMTPVTFKIFIPEPCYAAFTGTEEPDPEDTDAMAVYDYSFIHRRNDSSGNNDMVGWEKNADASKWLLEEAKSITIETSDKGYTTLYAPFAVQSPEGVSALVGKIESDHLELTGVKGVVPALTPVVLKAEPGTYEMSIVNSSAAPIEGNDLKGTLIEAKPGYAMTLEEVDGDMAFYTFEGEAIEANKAYLRLSDTSIEVFPIHVGDLTGIKTVDNDATEHEMYDLSGRRVNKTGKGVYIIDGKKMMVK